MSGSVKVDFNTSCGSWTPTMYSGFRKMLLGALSPSPAPTSVTRCRGAPHAAHTEAIDEECRPPGSSPAIARPDRGAGPAGLRPQGVALRAGAEPERPPSGVER